MEGGGRGGGVRMYSFNITLPSITISHIVLGELRLQSHFGRLAERDRNTTNETTTIVHDTLSLEIREFPMFSWYN